MQLFDFLTHIVPSISILHSAFNILHLSTLQLTNPFLHQSILIHPLFSTFSSYLVVVILSVLLSSSLFPSLRRPSPPVLSVHSLKAVMRPLLPSLLPSFPLPYSFCFYITSSSFHSSHSRSSAAAAKFPLISRLSVSFTSSFDYLIMMIICSR